MLGENQAVFFLVLILLLSEPKSLNSQTGLTSLQTGRQVQKSHSDSNSLLPTGKLVLSVEVEGKRHYFTLNLQGLTFTKVDCFYYY